MSYFLQKELDQRFSQWESCIFTEAEDINKGPHVIELVFKSEAEAMSTYSNINKWTGGGKDFGLNMSIVANENGYSCSLFTSSKGKAFPETFTSQCKFLKKTDLDDFFNMMDCKHTVVIAPSSLMGGSVVQCWPPDSPIMLLESVSVR